MDKRYTDFMDEISPDELYEGLLAYGFFAEKLPPLFTAVPFFNYCKTIPSTFESGWNEYIAFRTMRSINIPRHMGVPNPFKYQRLCVELKNDWDKIRNHFHLQTDGQSFRISRIHIRKIIELPASIENNWKHQLSDLPKVGESGMVEYPQINIFIDTALMLSMETGDLAIINYAIKKLRGARISGNGKKLAAKRFMHMAALYPYLLPLLEEYVFIPYEVDISDIKALSDTIYKNAINLNDYESLCYSIYYAIRFGFVLNELEIDYIRAQDYIINSKDCLLLIMTWVYYMQQNHWKRDATQVKRLNRVAMELKNSDMDRYWLFCYEALSWGSLPGQWRTMKQAGISFIRKEIVDVTTGSSTKSN